jgi:8-oxo-dGTP pyrophosphatase MutT (NUDIX family)
MASEPLPSATIVVLRDGAAGLEVLLLDRVEKEGKPGPSVFPGGRVDPLDHVQGDEGDAALRRAAVREAREEAGLELAADALLPISRWITPEISPRRFDTWFYLAAVPGETTVRVDGSEIARHHWLAPEAALAAHHERRLRLAPPTFVTVSWLLGHGSADGARQSLAPGPPVVFRPRVCQVGEGACMLYPGDAGYEASDPGAPGARHRLWALPGGWRYERG